MVAAVQLADLVIHLEGHSLVCPIICLLQGGQDEEQGGEHGKKRNDCTRASPDPKQGTLSEAIRLINNEAATSSRARLSAS